MNTETISLEPASPEVKRYQRLKIQATIISACLVFLLLAVAGLALGPWMNDWIERWVSENRWLRLIALAAVYATALEVLTLPLSFWSGYILEHRFQLSNQSLGAWIWRQVKGYLLGAPLGLALLFGLYALLWYGGRWWWAWATVGWLVVTLVLGRLLPVLILPLFYKVTRLEDGSLLERLRKMAAGTGLDVEGIYRLHLSEETKKANAALAGLGRSRRVLLGDTLLEQFSPEEIEVVFAHEVGHHVHRHIIKMVVEGVLLAAAGFWLVDLILRGAAPQLGYTAFNDPAALPLLILVLMGFGLVLTPLQNALSRFYERQCDRYALVRTRAPESYRSAFVKLARLNKADPDPHPVVVWLLYDHPPIRQRLALAENPAFS